jgi:hypothetical protein
MRASNKQCLYILTYLSEGICMKHYLGILLIVGTSTQLPAMNNGSQKSRMEKTRTERDSDGSDSYESEPYMEKYFSTLGVLGVIGGLLFMGREYIKPEDAIKLITKIDQLPVVLKTRTTTLEEFFHPEELKKCLVRNIILKWHKGSLRKRHLANMIDDLKSCLKMDALRKEFGDLESARVERALTLDIDDIGTTIRIDLKQLPKFFRVLLKNYFKIDALQAALEHALQGALLTKEVVDQCLDHEGNKERHGSPEVSKLIHFFIGILDKSLDSPSLTEQSSVASRAEQIATDEDFARRLERAWSYNGDSDDDDSEASRAEQIAADEDLARQLERAWNYNSDSDDDE